jgi:hypothetical protein
MGAFLLSGELYIWPLSGVWLGVNPKSCSGFLVPETITRRYVQSLEVLFCDGM